MKHRRLGAIMISSCTSKSGSYFRSLGALSCPANPSYYSTIYSCEYSCVFLERKNTERLKPQNWQNQNRVYPKDRQFTCPDPPRPSVWRENPLEGSGPSPNPMVVLGSKGVVHGASGWVLERKQRGGLERSASEAMRPSWGDPVTT